MSSRRMQERRAEGEDNECRQDSTFRPPDSDSDSEEGDPEGVQPERSFSDLLKQTGLMNNFPGKLRMYEVNKIYDDSELERSSQYLPLLFINKITSLDARSVLPEGYEFMGKPIKWSMRDFLFALFVSCDEFLRQKVIKYLAQCCLAVPVMLPSIETFKTTAISLGLRTVVKKWKPNNDTDMAIEKPISTQTIFSVGCIRFGKLCESKSGILNVLLGRSQGNKEHYFFLTHKEDPIEPVFSKGTVEASWLVPTEHRAASKPLQITTVLNLRGDAANFPLQLQFLCDTVNILLVFINHKDRQRVFTENGKFLEQNVNKFHMISLDNTKSVGKVKRDRNWIMAKITNNNYVELGRTLGEILADECSECSSLHSIHSLTTDPQDPIVNDESNNIKMKALKEVAKVFDEETKSLTVDQFHEKHFPLLKIWQQWVKIDKERIKRGQLSEDYIDNKNRQKKYIRTKQMYANLSQKVETMFTTFLNALRQKDNNKSLSYYMTYSQFQISDMLELSMESTLRRMHELEALETDLSQNQINECLQKYNDLSFGLEHFLREIGQWYEANADQRKSFINEDIFLSGLPKVATRLLLMGYPIEILDGDTAHIPITWIKAILKRTKEELGDPNLFVISVIGMQSSGKSTLLNSMFGAQFSVRAGRCTKGLFMQIVEVEKSFSASLGFKYLLVVDTEGLRTPERSLSEQYNFDNELATLAMCLGDLTLLNTEGECMNPQMVDILQITMHALIRMKEVNLHSHCYIIQQKVSDVMAAVRNKGAMQGICDALNKATELAAKEENVTKYKKFSEVFEFHPVTDVLYMPNLWSDAMSAPNHSYSETVRALKLKIYSEIQKGKINPQFSVSTFAQRLEIIYKSIKSENFVFSFKSTMNVISYSKFLRTYNKWIANMRSEMLIWELNESSSRNVKEFSLFLQRQLIQQKQQISSDIDQYIKDNNNVAFDARKLEEMFKTDLDKTIEEIENTMTEYYQAKKLDEDQISNVSKFVESWRIKFREMLHTNFGTYPIENTLQEVQKRAKFNQIWNLWKGDLLKDYELRAIKEEDINNFCKSSLTDVIRETPNNTAYERCRIPVESLTDFPQGVSEYASAGMQFRGEADSSTFISKLKDKVSKVLSQAELQRIGPFNRSTVKLTLQIALAEVGENNEVSLEREGIVLVMKHVCARISMKLIENQKLYLKNNSMEKLLQNVKEECYKEFLSFVEQDQQSDMAANLLYNHLLKVTKDIIQKEINSVILSEMRKNDHFINRQILIRAILDDIGREDSVASIIDFLSGMCDYVKRWLKKSTTNLCMEKRSNNDQTWLENQLVHVISKLKSHVCKSVFPCTDSISIPFEDWLMNFFSRLQTATNHKWDSDQSLNNFSRVMMDEFLSHLSNNLKKFELDSFSNQLSKTITVETVDTFLSNLPKPPHQELLDQISGCWKQCMFCGAACHIQNKGHKEHSALIHHSQALVGFRYISTQMLVPDICTTLVASNKEYKLSGHENSTPYKDYKKEFKDWDIAPIEDAEPTMFWKWIMAKFNDEIATHFNAKPASLPNGWNAISQEEGLQSLSKTFNMRMENS